MGQETTSFSAIISFSNRTSLTSSTFLLLLFGQGVGFPVILVKGPKRTVLNQSRAVGVCHLHRHLSDIVLQENVIRCLTSGSSSLKVIPIRFLIGLVSRQSIYLFHQRRGIRCLEPVTSECQIRDSHHISKLGRWSEGFLFSSIGWKVLVLAKSKSKSRHVL